MIYPSKNAHNHGNPIIKWANIAAAIASAQHGITASLSTVNLSFLIAVASRPSPAFISITDNATFL